MPPFESSQDEKIWAALKTVNNRYRLFWVAEAIFLSVALAVMGIIWLGETTATTSDGISTPPDDGLSSSEDDDTEPWTTQKWNEDDTVRAQMFNWLFACFIAPFGATVLAWEAAFVLQSVADRCDTRETTHSSSNLKQFALLEAFFLVNLGLSVVELVFSQLMFSYDRVLSPDGLVFLLVRIILLAVLTTVGVAGICLPCGKWRPPHSFCKALVGLGIGAIAFLSTPFVVERIFYGFKYLLPKLIVETFAAASWFTCIFSLASAIFETFEGYPARFRVVAWRIGKIGSSSSDDDDGGSSTVLGCAFVVVCMYVSLYVLEVFIYAIYFGDVKI